MIVVTGAAGFIGSALISKLNSEFFNDIVAVDEFSSPVKNKNLENRKITARVEREKFFNWLKENHRQVEFIFHLGARTDTAETSREVLNQLNLDYSKNVWKLCVEFGVPLIYASSAATYGAGELGYDDDPDLIPQLKPLNAYGDSKNEFDIWALGQPEKPYFWTGLKFFNVYGPNEYHKGRMASVVFHAFNQISDNGSMKLFRSHRPDFSDGCQMRDFIYVKDITNVLYYLMHHRNSGNNGIYNLGTGEARTFLDLANAVFKSLNRSAEVSFIDTPEDIRDKYQYFTEAKMGRLMSTGYSNPFTSLEEGVNDYVKNYLLKGAYLE